MISLHLQIQQTKQLILNYLQYLQDQKPSDELDAAIECLKSEFQIQEIKSSNELEKLIQKEENTQEQQFSAEEYKNQGNELMKQEKYEEAIQIYSKAIEQNQLNNESKENLAVYYANRGLAKKNLNKLQEAVQDYQKALEINPQYTKAQQRLEVVQQLLNQNQQSNQNQGFFANMFQNLQQQLSNPEIQQKIINNPLFQQAINNPSAIQDMLGGQFNIGDVMSIDIDQQNNEEDQENEQNNIQ